MQKFKKLDHFQILQVLGRGANGLVYKGLNTLNGSIVAIKEILIGKSQVKAIKTELNLLKQLDNPCIVKYIDAIQKQNKIFLILEYMEGGSLGALVRKSPLDEEVAKIYIKQVLKGLTFLHKQQVIHRDIKGANILLTKNGLVKLADFGVAVRLEDSQKTISAAGSPYWMAPQIISSESEPSTKCDIWSLGCTVIELLTGNPPYYELMQFPAMFRIVEDKYPPLPQCSPECREFLLACFIKDPKKRPSAAQLLNSNWLKSAKDHEVNLLRERQQTLIKEIGRHLQPIINYQQLQNILKQSKNSFLICKHKYFYAVIMDSKNNSNCLRTNFFINLMKNDENVVQYLHKMGIFSQQFQKMKDKYQFSQQSLCSTSNIISTLIEIYDKRVRRSQIDLNICQNPSENDFSLIQSIITQKCIPIISKILSSFTKDRKKQTKQSMIINLHRFISTFLSKRNFQQEKQLLLQIIVNLEQSGGLKQIENLSYQINNEVQQNLYFIKLDIIFKISKYLVLLAELKLNFKKHIIFLMAQLLKYGFLHENETIVTVKFMCFTELMSEEKYKYVMQRNGFIFYLAEYYENVCGTKQLNFAAIFQSILCLTKMLQNGKGGIDKNRVLQFYKHRGNKSLQTIYSRIHNQPKNGKKEINSGALFQKIRSILAIVQNYRA